MNQREDISLPPASAEWLLTQLAWVAKTGVSKLRLGNPMAETLAATIAALVSENEYLKKILGARLLVTSEDKKVSIAFGPANRFVLDIPVNNDDEKREIAAALSAAGSKILYELANAKDQTAN